MVLESLKISETCGMVLMENCPLLPKIVVFVAVPMAVLFKLSLALRLDGSSSAISHVAHSAAHGPLECAQQH